MTRIMHASLTLACLIASTANAQIASEGADPPATATSTFRIVARSDVQWGALNPARGKNGPRAGTLWGDRTDAGPSGFLVEFADGFSSPPHVHNVSYRALVIGGMIHNDDPGADEMWMPAGSFWTQPRGAIHITAADSGRSLAYVEIEEGPYLVRPPEKAFTTEEVPLNLDATNLVWLDQPRIPSTRGGPRLAFLWGDPHGGEAYGTLVKLSAGFAGTIRNHGSTFRGVVIQGRTMLGMPDLANSHILDPGSYFEAKGESAGRVSCSPADECLIYVHTDGHYEVLEGARPR